MIRRIRKKEFGNGMKYCDFCRPVKVSAIWREKGMGGRLACEKHKSRLDNGLDNHMTEADYQMWGRIR